MGSMQAMSLAEGIEEGWASLRQALAVHLQSNHYPPVHPVFIPVAQKAIEHAEQEDWGHIISMPNGVDKSVASIVEELHLDAFIAGMWEDED